MEPGSLSDEQQIILMAEVRGAVEKIIEERNESEAHQMALAGILMRTSISLYNGVLVEHEIESLLEYVMENLEAIPPIHPIGRTLN